MNIKLRQNADSLLGPGHEGQVVMFARRHWASFFSQIILSAVILIIPAGIIIALLIFQPSFYSGIFTNIIVITISVYYLIALTFVFTAWIIFYYDIYIVTNDSLYDITQQGFFGRKTAQLSLLRIQDVSCKVTGIIPTMFGYGDVLVETAGEKVENFLLEAVPDPQKFCSKVMELHDALIAREGRDQQALSGEGTFVANNRSDNSPVVPSTPPVATSTPAQTTPQTQPVSPIPPDPTASDADQINVSKDDLNNGGEIKF